jgi:hypothetical protein
VIQECQKYLGVWGLLVIVMRSRESTCGGCGEDGRVYVPEAFRNETKLQVVRALSL